jgi:hypothetical protein
VNETELDLSERFFSDLRRAALTRGVPVGLSFTSLNPRESDPWSTAHASTVKPRPPHRNHPSDHRPSRRLQPPTLVHVAFGGSPHPGTAFATQVAQP